MNIDTRQCQFERYVHAKKQLVFGYMECAYLQAVKFEVDVTTTSIKKE
jgi:hypothetical protein